MQRKLKHSRNVQKNWWLYPIGAVACIGIIYIFYNIGLTLGS
ncbi:hypothetical protein [Miniphocaeibacter massiliensis]|nr:hypothetical protein [Miniphocaeibacter massiliensis]